MQSILMMWTPSGPELAIILVLVVMLFGLGKLPAVAKQVGAGMRDFKKSLNGEDEEEDEDGSSAALKELESEESIKATDTKKSRVASS